MTIRNDLVEQIIDSASYGCAYWADRMEIDEDSITIRDAVGEQEHTISNETILDTATKWAADFLESSHRNRFFLRAAKEIHAEDWDQAACAMDAELADILIQLSCFKTVQYC